MQDTAAGVTIRLPKLPYFAIGFIDQNQLVGSKMVDRLTLFPYSTVQLGRQAISPFVLIDDVSDPVQPSCAHALVPERHRRTDNTQSPIVGH